MKNTETGVVRINVSGYMHRKLSRDTDHLAPRRSIA
jgi:hypothetical protein